MMMIMPDVKCKRKFSHVHSFDTKSAPRISIEPFDLESPIFTVTSVPTLSTATTDMTSLSTSDWKF